MSAVAEELVAPSPEHVDQRIVLRNVSWRGYENLLSIRGESSGTRITYHHGDLELMTPSIDHEGFKTKLARLIEVYADEQGIELEGYGSWTVKIKARKLGVEPDECYVLGSPPPKPTRPDIAVEVIWTSGGIDKLDVYAGLEVPEVWFWEQGELRIFILEAGGYRQTPRSRLLPELDLDLLVTFMQGTSQSRAVRAFRQALRSRREGKCSG